VPLRRVGRHAVLANLAVYLGTGQRGLHNGACVTIDGGRRLRGAGNLSFLEGLSEAKWESFRPRTEAVSSA
jgi:hypothetical protein